MGLQSLENGLGRIVDGVLNRAFKNNVRPIEIGRRLIREMDTQRSVNSLGQRIVPNHYTVTLSSADFDALEPYVHPLIEELVHAAEQYCTDEGYTLTGSVTVDISRDDTAARRKVVVSSEFTSSPESAPAPPAPKLPLTTPPTLVQASVPAAPPMALHATLVLSDGRDYPLGETPMVIGRLSECDITIEDPNISRRHATITLLDDTFRIMDLGSTNGTKVNGARISSQFTLSHGDEITIGLVSMRFEIR